MRTERRPIAYAYDANGNTIVKTDGTGSTSYTWDYENRMTSVILPGSGGTVTFRYDPFRRRIYKSSSSGTSIYAYDGDNLVEETNSSGGVVARYSQGLNIDEPLAMLRGGATSYYQADGLGSVTSLTNSAGAAAQNYTYDSFGNTVATSGSLVNSFQYTGREFDTETSLYYYRARYYDSSAGRFASQDPLKFFGGDINFYRYVWNDSSNLRDPRGLWGAGACVGGSFFAGVASSEGSGLSFSNCVGGVVLKDPSGGFTPVAFNSYGGAAGGTRPSSGMCGNNGHNETAGLNFGLGPSLVLTNANSAGDLAGQFYNTSFSIPLIVSGEIGFGKNGVIVLNINAPNGLSFGFGSANYTSNTVTSPAPPSGNSCDCGNN